MFPNNLPFYYYNFIINKNFFNSFITKFNPLLIKAKIKNPSSIPVTGGIVLCFMLSNENDSYKLFNFNAVFELFQSNIFTKLEGKIFIKSIDGMQYTEFNLVNGFSLAIIDDVTLIVSGIINYKKHFINKYLSKLHDNSYISSIINLNLFENLQSVLIIINDNEMQFMFFSEHQSKLIKLFIEFYR